MNMQINKKHNPRKVYTLVVIAFIAVTVLFAMGETQILTRAFWQGMGFLVFCVCVFLITKFGFYEYKYILSDDGFVIIKTVGNKDTKVCHLDLDTIVAVLKPDEWKEEKKIRRITAIYNYNASVSPDEYYVVLFELDGKVSAVKFEGNAQMYEGIKGIILAPKENQ